jgi:hypothetical protein
MLAVANIFFFVFHTALILFNVLGWIWRPTRKWNLLTLGLTFISWCVMGLWKGVGYCICTDWHWQIRHAMGIHDNADSYLVLLVQKLTGWNPPIGLVNSVAGVVFLLSIGLSVGLNLRDWRRARRRTAPVTDGS